MKVAFVRIMLPIKMIDYLKNIRERLYSKSVCNGQLTQRIRCGLMLLPFGRNAYAKMLSVINIIRVVINDDTIDNWNSYLSWER